MVIKYLDNKWCTCLSVISLDSIVNADKKYPQIFLEECKHAVKKKKILNSKILLMKNWNQMSLIMISLINQMKIKIVFQMIF